MYNLFAAQSEGVPMSARLLPCGAHVNDLSVQAAHAAQLINFHFGGTLTAQGKFAMSKVKREQIENQTN